MSKQSQKYHLSMAGEFFVAAELQRRGVSAAVTYGNAKAADVVAFAPDGERAVVIEVKSTAQGRWVVGGALPEPSKHPWVFVKIPAEPSLAPTYFVLLQSELRDALLPGDDAYRARYQAKHGQAFTGKAVVSLSESLALPHKDAWGKILSAIGV